ncbi:14-3-3 protein [Mortierella sp. NVP85]|nr:14-3-3 protein [Mortierella sp. NVP85]
MVKRTRRDHLFLAKVARDAERYEVMAMHMKKVIALNPNLSVEERKLYSVAYEKWIGARYGSWQCIDDLQQDEAVKEEWDIESEMDGILLKEYSDKVAEEVYEICSDALKTLEESLIQNAVGLETKVSYLKLKADCYHYIGRVTYDDRHEAAADKGLEAYAVASAFARGLSPIHPIRLSLALNFSRFHDQVLNSKEESEHVAREAIEDAKPMKHSLKESKHKKAASIMEQLVDIVAPWIRSSGE